MIEFKWHDAPEEADFYACGHFYRRSGGSSLYSVSADRYFMARKKLLDEGFLKPSDKWSWCLSFQDAASIKMFSDYMERPL